MMKNWHSKHLIKIRKALLWVYGKKDGIISAQSDGVENFIVIKNENHVSLHFMDTKTFQANSKISDIMSVIDITNPLNLLSTYTQVMMLSLVFKPAPKRLYMLGFGGGRVPMIFHFYFPKLVIEASEVSKGVLELAKMCFGIIPDERMKISLQDGCKHLATFPEKYFDIILLDSFSGIGKHPNKLSTLEFYQRCKSHLTDDGIMMTNLVDNNPYFKQKVATFCSSFKFSYQYASDGTSLFFGTDVDDLSSEEFQQKAKDIASQYEFEFSFVKRSQDVKRCKADQFSSKILTDENQV